MTIDKLESLIIPKTEEGKKFADECENDLKSEGILCIRYETENTITVFSKTKLEA